MGEPDLIKMSELARRTEVPASTIKHYIREGLVPDRAVRTSRNMAWYPADLAERIRLIRRLQKEQFLPLKVIKELLERDGADSTAAIGVARALNQLASGRSRSRADLVAAGTQEADLDWLQRIGLVKPDGVGAEARYRGDDLGLVETLSTARREGLTAEMIPASALNGYVQALEDLIRYEWAMFEGGVLDRAPPEDQERLAELATQLSERLIVLLRRKLLLPALREVRATEEDT